MSCFDHTASGGYTSEGVGKTGRVNRKVANMVLSNVMIKAISIEKVDPIKMTVCQ